MAEVKREIWVLEREGFPPSVFDDGVALALGAHPPLVRYVPAESRGAESAGAELLRRDWAVRVLDAWAAAAGIRKRVEYPIDNDGEAYIFLKDEAADVRIASRHWDGSSPDAARLAAAEAVWLELPESVRAELGPLPAPPAPTKESK